MKRGCKYQYQITQSAVKVQSSVREKEQRIERELFHGGIAQAAPFLLAHLLLSNGSTVITCVFTNWVTISLTNKENGAIFI